MFLCILIPCCIKNLPSFLHGATTHYWALAFSRNTHHCSWPPSSEHPWVWRHTPSTHLSLGCSTSLLLSTHTIITTLGISPSSFCTTCSPPQHGKYNKLDDIRLIIECLKLMVVPDPQVVSLYYWTIYFSKDFQKPVIYTELLSSWSRSQNHTLTQGESGSSITLLGCSG